MIILATVTERCDFSNVSCLQVSLRVVGSSIMARLLRKTIAAFNTSVPFDVDSSNAACAMTPIRLPPSVYLSCAACVLAVALCSILQIYSSRLRRVVAASFHPQREKMRVLFLYNLMLLRNRKCPDSERKSNTQSQSVSAVCLNCFCCCRPEEQRNLMDVQYEEG